MTDEKTQKEKAARTLESDQHAKDRQYKKFRELARKIGAVDSEEPLNEALRKVAKTTPPKEDMQKRPDKKP
ncbi:hypothetical protein D3227_02120 [Mesorhizobium waimense]|uniref:Uncharacterized protein n=1 Tax=Mesorhizobium waimense TaxID=1300307 RepID=A0A3A5L011_9HYPH|nr:hypothetical protein [Mesorhizobium waimense]RJT42670.1 hypothetical protein D3227_02120 [Mesorhizobium waimense]